MLLLSTILNQIDNHKKENFFCMIIYLIMWQFLTVTNILI